MPLSAVVAEGGFVVAADSGERVEAGGRCVSLPCPDDRIAWPQAW